MNIKNNNKHQILYGVARLQLKHFIGSNRITNWHERKNKNCLIFRYLNRPSKKVKEVFFSMDRELSRNILGIITEHDGLNYYKKRMNFIENNNGLCRFCLVNKEDIVHLIFGCNKNPFNEELKRNYCKISKLYKKVFRSKNVKFILFPMYLMINPGVYLSIDRTLKIYNFLNIYIKKVFSWKIKNKENIFRENVLKNNADHGQQY